MEFEVIEPKDHTFDEWLQKIEGFLSAYRTHERRGGERWLCETREGEIFFTQDDIADAWGEESLLYVVKGEQGGVIEARGPDTQLYMFTEDFAGRNLRDLKDGGPIHITRPSCAYGFEHNSLQLSKIHSGPIEGVYFLHLGEAEEYPLPTSYERLWGGGLLQVTQWVHNQVSRIQEQKQIINAEGTHNLLTLKATFSHPLMVTQLLEAVRSRNAIKAREQGYVHIELMNPTTDHLRDICARMPSDPEYYHKLSLKMSWGVDVVGVGRQEITYVGAEKRHMKPLIQIPTLSSSRAFRDACREYFSQYRVLRHEHAQR
jgi:hypothetical protein